MSVHWTILASFLQAWGPPKCTYQRNGSWADGSSTDETDWEQSLSVWCQCSLEGLSSQLHSGSCPAPLSCGRGVGSGSCDRLCNCVDREEQTSSRWGHYYGLQRYPRGCACKNTPHTLLRTQRSPEYQPSCLWDVPAGTCGLGPTHLPLGPTSDSTQGRPPPQLQEQSQCPQISKTFR